MEVPFGYQCLGTSYRKIAEMCNGLQTFCLLARQMEGKLTGNEMEMWAIVAWSVWNARNRFCFEAKQSRLSDILRGATTLLQDYQ